MLWFTKENGWWSFVFKILIVFQTIEWRFGQDETSLSPVQNVVELLSMSSDNSSIHFRPFSSNKYSSKIHSTFYQCFAINSVGVVASAVIDVRAGETENVFHLQIVFYFTFKFHKNINKTILFLGFKAILVPFRTYFTLVSTHN